MKTKKLTYVITALLAGITILSVSVFSCEKENIAPKTLTENITNQKMVSDLPDPGKICGSAKELNLVADNGSVIGKAVIFNDTKYFYVKFRCNNNYSLGDAAMHISPTSDQFPMDENRNPLISAFNHKIKGQSLSSTRSIIVPVSELYGQSYIAATVQAKSLHSNEKHSLFVSAWVDGRSFGNTVKGRVFVYKKQTCLETNGASNQMEEVK